MKKDDGEKAPDRSNKELQPKGKTIAKREVISINDLDEQFKKIALPLKEVSNRLDQLESRLQQPQQPFQRYTQRPYQNKPNWQKNDFPSPGSGNKNIPPQTNLAQIDAAQQLYDPNGNGQQQQGTSQRGDCHFCGQWGHYRQYCPRLGQMLSTNRIHMRDSRIYWGQEGSNGPPLPLDRSILQGDSVQQLIDQAMARTRAEQQITPAAQVSSLDDSDSDEEEEDKFCRNFTYQVLEDEDIQVQAAQTEPAKRGRPPKNPVVRPLVRPTYDDQTRVLKKRA